jgi:glycosyltransferase involved in cell wall biosynthesis
MMEESLKGKTNRCRRVLVIDGSARALMTVRGRLLSAAVQTGHQVSACAALDSYMPDVQIGDLTAKYDAIGVQFTELRMRRQNIDVLGDVEAIMQLWKIMRRLQPEVVLSYSAKSSIYGSLAARLTGVSEVYSAVTGLGYLFNTDDKRGQRLKQVVKRLWGFALRNNRRVFFLNPDDRDLFLKLGLVRDSAQTVIIDGEGVDVEHFAVAPFPPGPITFLMIARVQYHKGVVEYVEAARQIKYQYPTTRFQLIGPFDQHPSSIPRERMAQWQQDGVIEYMGGTPDVRPFLAQCHVFVLPSYREGLSLSMLEAMATGRPVVTTDVPGCREPVVDGTNGFIVPAKDAAALAAAMRKFLDGPELIPAMGHESRRLAVAKYEVQQVVNRMLRMMNLLSAV